MSVSFGDFKLINSWREDWGSDVFKDDVAIPKFIIDATTGRKYINESLGCIRFKCVLLTFGVPFVHSIASIANVAYRILKLVTLSHFWIKKDGEKEYSVKERSIDAGKDLLRIVATPFSILGLEFAAIYGGIFKPLDGRKLYASIERAAYGSFVSAPCFQPDAKRHLFGGNIEERDVF